MTLETVTEKTCKRCEQAKPHADFRVEKRVRDGLSATCRECSLGQMKARYEAKRETYIQAAKAYRDADPDRKKRMDREWRDRNRDQLLPRQRAYRAANIEAALARARRYREEHPETIQEWRASHVSQIREQRRQWVESHPDKVRDYKRTYYNRRRARIQDAPFERIRLADIIARDGARCAICGKAQGKDRWSIDHILPVSRGGSHTMANVRLTHFYCNSARGNRGAAQLRMLG